MFGSLSGQGKGDKKPSLFAKMRATGQEKAKDRSQHRAQYAAGSSGGDLDLHSAIAKGSFPLVRDLLAQGVPIDTLNTAHMTPLHAAVDADNYDIVELLLQKGAEPNAVSKANGETPIHLAKSPEIAELLINNKANMDARDEWLLSPLHHAAKSGLGDVVAVLLQHGARVDYYDGLHRTPLIVAAFSGHKECVEELASNGANLAAKDKSGRTALDLSKAMGHTEVHKLLAEMTKLLGDMGGDAQSLRALPAGSPARLQRGSNNLPAQRPPSSGGRVQASNAAGWATAAVQAPAPARSPHTDGSPDRLILA